MPYGKVLISNALYIVWEDRRTGAGRARPNGWLTRAPTSPTIVPVAGSLVPDGWWTSAAVCVVLVLGEVPVADRTSNLREGDHDSSF